MLRAMFKLAVYGVFGYAVYEFIRGAMGDQPQQAGNRLGEEARRFGQEAKQRGTEYGRQAMDQAREFAEQHGSGQGRQGQSDGTGSGQNARTKNNMTGAGEGKTMKTEEASGESVPHQVGRGVVH